MADRFAYPRFKGWNGSAVNAGGKLYIYENGTTTKVAAGSALDARAGSDVANPLILDADGEGDLYLKPGFLYTLKMDTSADVQIWSKDGQTAPDLASFVYSGSDISFQSGNVGIGGAAGASTLTVTGSGSFSTTLSVTGVLTVSSLTASQAVFTDGSKGLASNAITGTGNVVMSASPTLTGTIGAASQTLSGTLAVTGVATFTAQPIVSSLTASLMVGTDGSKGLVSVSKSSAYTITATSVLDRTLLASASATATNNNNVLAALLTDLQTANILA